MHRDAKGFGSGRVKKEERWDVLECWPIWVDVSERGGESEREGRRDPAAC